MMSRIIFLIILGIAIIIMMQNNVSVWWHIASICMIFIIMGAGKK
jgi:hypothetical protein